MSEITPNQMSDEQLRTAARNYRVCMLEGGDGYNPYQVELDRRAAEHQARVDAAYRQIKAIDAQEAAEFAAAWTREITQQRREAWNARVRAGEFGRQGGQCDYKALAKAQADQGWTMDQLKRAIKLHNL